MMRKIIPDTNNTNNEGRLEDDITSEELRTDKRIMSRKREWRTINRLKVTSKSSGNSNKEINHKGGIKTELKSSKGYERWNDEN